MGGNLLLNYILHRQPKIKGAIVTGSFIRLAFEPSPFVVALGKAMRSIFPGFTQSNQLDSNNISRDPEVVKAYNNDPLVHDRLTASLGTRLLDGGKFLDEWEGTFPCPLLIMHGGDDKITSPKGSKAFAERVKGDITHYEWPGLYHEIHNEKAQNEVFLYTFNWISKQLS
jgi:alpha-beta hydrolase superfamily lysophospholipase